MYAKNYLEVTYSGVFGLCCLLLDHLVIHLCEIAPRVTWSEFPLLLSKNGIYIQMKIAVIELPFFDVFAPPSL